MSIGDFIRLFFVFSAIQPILRQQMLEVMRSRKISQIDRDRKSRVSFWAPARDSCACSASRFPLYRDQRLRRTVAGYSDDRRRGAT
jgi:hypothetical protein